MTFGNGPGVGEQVIEPHKRGGRLGGFRPESAVHYESMRKGTTDPRGTPTSPSELGTVNCVYGATAVPTVSDVPYSEQAVQNYLARCAEAGMQPNPESIAGLRTLDD